MWVCICPAYVNMIYVNHDNDKWFGDDQLDDADEWLMIKDYVSVLVLI